MAFLKPLNAETAMVLEETICSQRLLLESFYTSSTLGGGGRNNFLSRRGCSIKYARKGSEGFVLRFCYSATLPIL